MFIAADALLTSGLDMFDDDEEMDAGADEAQTEPTDEEEINLSSLSICSALGCIGF